LSALQSQTDACCALGDIGTLAFWRTGRCSIQPFSTVYCLLSSASRFNCLSLAFCLASDTENKKHNVGKNLFTIWDRF